MKFLDYNSETGIVFMVFISLESEKKKSPLSQLSSPALSWFGTLCCRKCCLLSRDMSSVERFVESSIPSWGRSLFVLGLLHISSRSLSYLSLDLEWKTVKSIWAWYSGAELNKNEILVSPYLGDSSLRCQISVTSSVSRSLRIIRCSMFESLV